MQTDWTKLWNGLFAALSATLMTFPACLSTGCAAGETDAERDASLQRNIQVLRDAQFHGQVDFKAAGSPIALHLVNSFELGPKQSDFSASGSVDFRPRVNNLTPAAANMLMERMDAIESRLPQ